MSPWLTLPRWGLVLWYAFVAGLWDDIAHRAMPSCSLLQFGGPLFMAWLGWTHRDDKAKAAERDAPQEPS